MNRACAAVASFAVAAFMLVSASAVTVVNDTDVVAIGTGSEFIGSIVGNGGAGTWTVQFDAATDLLATSTATIGPIVFGTFTGLTMGWVSLVSGLLDSVGVIPDTLAS